LSRAKISLWRGERGQGRRTVAFIWTLEAAPHALSLGPGTKRELFSPASFLSGMVFWFSQDSHGFIGFTALLRRRKSQRGLASPSICLRSLLATRIYRVELPLCARGRVLIQGSGPVLRPCQASSFPATRSPWRSLRLSLRRRNIQYRRVSSLRAIATFAMGLPRRSTSLQYTRFNS
jgi:hypothetical protein